MEHLRGELGSARLNDVNEVLKRFGVTQEELEGHGLSVMSAYFILHHQILNGADTTIEQLLTRERIGDKAQLLAYFMRFFSTQSGSAAASSNQ
jgi:hypothetical protein